MLGYFKELARLKSRELQLFQRTCPAQKPGTTDDERTRQLTYVNAGHNPPFLFRPEAVAEPAEQWRALSTGGLFIGAFDHLQYEEETLELRSGDVLVAYTDGVTEAMSAAGGALLAFNGFERQRPATRPWRHVPAHFLSGCRR